MHTHENSVSQVSVEVEDEMDCGDYLRSEDLVTIFTDVKDPVSLNKLENTSWKASADISQQVERVGNIASLRETNPLLDFQKGCSLKCLAYRYNAKMVECHEAGECQEFQDFVATYAHALDLKFKKNMDKDRQYPLALYSKVDKSWYLMDRFMNSCRYKAVKAQQLSVAFAHPATSRRLEVQFVDDEVIVVFENCEDEICTKQTEKVELFLEPETYRRSNDIVATGKFHLISMLPNGDSLKLKVDDCVADVMHSDQRKESFFPGDDVSCLNLEKIKQKIRHPL